MLTPPQALEALLFASGEALEKKRAAALLGIDAQGLGVVARALSEQLTGRGVSLIESEDALELRTNAEAATIVKQLRESELARDLGKASLETLAVVAYQNGATRSEIDWVRGVNSSASVRTLLMRGLIEGKEDPRDKRRVRYTLTTEAFATLGLTGAEDLPRRAELSQAEAAVLAEQEAAAGAPSEDAS